MYTRILQILFFLLIFIILIVTFCLCLKNVYDQDCIVAVDRCYGLHFKYVAKHFVIRVRQHSTWKKREIYLIQLPHCYAQSSEYIIEIKIITEVFPLDRNNVDCRTFWPWRTVLSLNYFNGYCTMNIYLNRDFFISLIGLDPRNA